MEDLARFFAVVHAFGIVAVRLVEERYLRLIKTITASSRALPPVEPVAQATR